MLTNHTTASQISSLLLRQSQELEDSVRLVMDTCTAEEFQIYRRAVAEIMGGEMLTILTYLYIQHPDLKPPEFHIPDSWVKLKRDK